MDSNEIKKQLNVIVNNAHKDILSAIDALDLVKEEKDPQLKEIQRWLMFGRAVNTLFMLHYQKCFGLGEFFNKGLTTEILNNLDSEDTYD